MEAVGRLAGGVAHDFNNLLTAILGYTDLLSERMKGDDPLREHVEIIRKAAERATNLTRQLLAFGRKQILRPAVLDLNALLAEMDQILKIMIHEKIELVLHPAPSLGRVKADRGQIEQIVTNLVLNARDALPEGGSIVIETANVLVDETNARSHRPVPPGDYVLLSVCDTGVGMDLETQSHLFEPFFTTKPKGVGTGLGLATIYGIVKQTEGYIRAFSELGHGTTFEIYLPRVENEVTPPEAEPQVEKAAMRGSETILLVEDENIVRRLAKNILEEEGYRVLVASNGPEALQVARKHDGDLHLLLTDVVMPRMSGREVADRLVPEREGMKVLFMSGHTEDAIVHHGVLEPGVAFLQKPFTPQNLLLRVREVLDGEQPKA